ncbi:choice-of-anchor M domain-containing protein [Conexibacter arvalis]|uniref:Surface-anchored protein n=1 Tax=Conexibacter arvalis TaxID=912552 RepID=A0A840IDB8_9ACTN|nr:choice-of-anchor M domain-containing protein [Conexibacter arvalis]MBB4662849.1 surface-anchored protein [Conexibacter arvalis]
MLGLSAALVAALAPASASAELPTQDRHVLSAGHVDAVGVHLDDGALRVRLHDDTGAAPVERDPGDVLLHVKPQAAFTIPAGIPQIYYDTLGPAGSTVWMLPQTQDPDLLWPGWSSEQIPNGAVAGDRFAWRLLSVDGPAAFQLYEEGAFGLQPSGIRFNSADGLPDTTSMHAGTHAHFAWAFGARGLYRLRFEVSATPLGGAEVSSGPVEYRIFVGDLADLPDDPDPVVPVLSIGGLKGHYHPGDTITLHAVQTPDSGEHHYHWFARCGDATEFAEVGGGATHELVAELRHDGCQYRVTLYGHGHDEIATSPAVTIHVEDHHGHGPGPDPDPAPVDPTPPTEPGPPILPAPPVPPAPEPPAQPRPGAPGGRAAAPRLTLGAARLDGRRLTLRLRVDRSARLTVRVRKGRRLVAGAKPRAVRASDGRVRVRLGRKLAPGRYRVVVKARARGRVVTRTIALRVAAR